LRRALRRVWQDPSIDEITAVDLAGDYPAVEYVAPDGTPIDILSRLGEAFAFSDIEARIFSYGDVEVNTEKMPVRKFRSLDDAARSLWLNPGDPRIWDGMVRRWRLHSFFVRQPTRMRTPGVFRYRSIADKHRQESPPPPTQ